MKAIVDGRAWDAAVRALPKFKSPRPGDLCARIKATGSGGAGRVTLTAWDGAVGLSLTLRAVDVQREGELVIPLEWLKSAGDSASATYTLEGEGEALHFRTDSAASKGFGYSVEDANNVRALPDFRPLGAGFAARELVSGFGQVDYCIAREFTRYAIVGVLFESKGNKLTLAATDGRRLAYDSSIGEGDDLTGVIPALAVALARKIGKKAIGARVERHANESEVWSIHLDGLEHFTARIFFTLVEGGFPPFRDCVPDAPPVASVTVERKALSAALKAGKRHTSEEARGIRLEIPAGKGGSVALSARAPERGEWSASLGAETVAPKGDKPFAIGFHPGYLGDIADALDTYFVRLDLIAPNKPGVVRNCRSTHVLMPVSLT